MISQLGATRYVPAYCRNLDLHMQRVHAMNLLHLRLAPQ